MEAGQSSGTKQQHQQLDENDVWAKLVPSDPSYPHVDIRLDESTICSPIMRSSSERQQWCIIKRASGKATVRNIRSSVIHVNNTPLGIEESTSIECGCEIVPGSNSGGYLSYFFRTISAEKQEEKVLKIPLDVDHAKCGICLSIWHDVVTVSPCLHNFCNGCLSEWMMQSRKKRQDVLCPQCRTNIASVGKNHFIHVVEEAIVQNASLGQSDEEIAYLNQHASIETNVVIKKKRRKREQSFFSIDADEGYTVELSCLQCDTELGGFKCNQNTEHLKCEACGEMMPSRLDIPVPQRCVGCDRAYCFAYWLAQGVIPPQNTAICGCETFRPVHERVPSSIPSSAHQNNQYEINVTENCIRQSGKALPDIISEFLVKLNDQEIDRSRMPLNHAELVNADTFLCNECYDKLVGYLLYWFRITLPKYLLPPDASKREDCWYGYACRTQHRSDEHARKRNHVCRPTRGSSFLS